jgi:hypothetical protein
VPFRASNTTRDGCNDTIYVHMSQVESYQVRVNNGAETAPCCAMSHIFKSQ